MNLSKNERLISKESQHWIGLLFPAMMALPSFFCLFSMSILIFTTPPPHINPQEMQDIINTSAICTCCLLTVTFFVVVHGVLNYALSKLYITSRRVVIERGVISRYFGEILYEQIETINVKQSLPGQIFGYGTVAVVGTGGTSEYVRRVSNPHQVRERINHALETARHREREKKSKKSYH